MSRFLNQSFRAFTVLDCALSFWVLSTVIAAAGTTYPIRTERDSQITIEVEPIFERVPPAGFVPCTVKISNDDGKPHSWTMTAQVYSYPQSRASSFSFNVEARTHRDFPVLIPVGAARSPGEAFQRYISIAFRGFGTFGEQARILGSGYSANVPTEFVLMGAKLAVENWGPLEESLQKQSCLLFGSRISTPAFPVDSLALLGVSSIWLSEEEWRSLSQEQLHALDGWVHAGGCLNVCDEAVQEDPGIEERRGLGRLRHIRTRNGRIAGDRFAAETKPKTSGWVQALKNPVQKHSLWVGDLGNLEHSVGFVATMVILFGVIVGPVNLFVLARGPRRHLVFITTPALCLGASLIGAGAIYLKDGLGGEGYRTAIIQVMQDRNEIRITQEQAVRTGLLPSGDFDVPGRALLTRSDVEPISRSERVSLSQSGSHYSGDWFRNRWFQAQQIEAVRASRAAISIKPVDGGLELISSYEGDLDWIFVKDEKGRVWKGTAASPGKVVRLSPGAEAEFMAAIRKARSENGPVADAAVSSASSVERLWIASGPGALGDFVPTHPAIRWTKQRVILFGEVNP